MGMEIDQFSVVIVLSLLKIDVSVGAVVISYFYTHWDIFNQTWLRRSLKKKEKVFRLKVIPFFKNEMLFKNNFQKINYYYI